MSTTRMSNTTIVALRGISENFDHNLLSYVRQRVTGLGMSTTWLEVPYPATFGGLGPDYDTLREMWSDKVQDIVQREINIGRNVIVLGYSAGADIAGDAMSADAWGTASKDNRVRLVGLVADPKTPLGKSGFPGRSGIAGPRSRNHPRAVWYSNPVDVIASCPPVSGWRKFYAAVRGWSVMDPRKWSNSLIVQAQLGNLGVSWSFDDYRLGRGYLVDGQHSKWYVDSGKLNELVRDIKAVL